MSETNDVQPSCSTRQIKVTAQDLPLSCPMDNMILWNAHPKVYLPILTTRHAVCPYCSTEYILTS